MDVREQLNRQDGVIARRQAIALGFTDSDIERLLRRREWARIASGVYVNHTGPLAETQREWSAVIAHRSAALAGRTALRRAGIATGSDHGGRELPKVEIVVPFGETPAPLPGTAVTRRRDFDAIVHPTRRPPTVRIEEAALDVAQFATEHQAVAILSDACRSRLTTADRLRTTARGRARLRQRRFLMATLDDAAEGSHSYLEWRYLRYVERVHALPRGARQLRASASERVGYRDVTYRRCGVVVELDGRLGHDLAVDRWADLDRDLASIGAGLNTIRLGYGQVLAPCRCAALIAGILRTRGWQDSPKACGPDCNLAG